MLFYLIVMKNNYKFIRQLNVFEHDWFTFKNKKKNDYFDFSAI